MQQHVSKLLSLRKRKVLKDVHLKHSAVLVPLFIKDGGYHMLFIKRSQEVAYHKGEISFPGGLCEKDDEGPEKTALREAFEETGIHPQEVRVLGTLDDMATVSTNYKVTPIVGVIPYPYPFIKNAREIDEIIEISLAHLGKEPFRFAPYGSSCAPQIEEPGRQEQPRCPQQCRICYNRWP